MEMEVRDMGGFRHQPIVNELIMLLSLRPDLKTALQESIHKANRGITTLSQYFDFLDEVATLIPIDKDIPNVMNEFYYLVNQSPILQADPSFRRWLVNFAEELGSFLDTTQSAAGLETFFRDPGFSIDDYYVEPSGWLTFNQFFARRVRPGRRPVHGLCDDTVIVSPADSVHKGQWAIGADSQITVKGVTHSVLQLLDGSPYQERFRGGLFTHSYLSARDYHWYHLPVRGVIQEVRNIPGKVSRDVIERPDGTLEVVAGTGFQFTQMRGLLVIDSPVGLVAVLPIGMGQVSSVNLLPEAGAELVKGQEFGFFLFGASDIVILFEADRVKLTAAVGSHYKQGVQIGHASLRCFNRAAAP